MSHLEQESDCKNIEGKSNKHLGIKNIITKGKTSVGKHKRRPPSSLIELLCYSSTQKSCHDSPNIICNIMEI